MMGIKMINIIGKEIKMLAKKLRKLGKIGFSNKNVSTCCVSWGWLCIEITYQYQQFFHTELHIATHIHIHA